VKLPDWRRAVLPYLMTLQEAAGTDARTTTELLIESGETVAGWRSVVRGRGRHSIPTRLALAVDQLGPNGGGSPRRRRLLEAGRAIAEGLLEAIGDGILLHPAHPRPAPRHGRTVARPWLMVPAAVFNLAGVPVTEVPLGLSESGLPVGVQVAAAPGRDDMTIAVALELERVFGGWVPPPASEQQATGGCGARGRPPSARSGTRLSL
jgi:fatty acid amide hydrolase 2